MTYILPDNPVEKVSISQPSNGRLLYSFVGGNTVVVNSGGNFELSQIDMTRRVNRQIGNQFYNFRKIFNERVNEAGGGGGFSSGFSDGFDI